jgi:hypothetical protein
MTLDVSLHDLPVIPVQHIRGSLHKSKIFVNLDSFSERANLIFALSRIMAQQALGHLALRRISRARRFQAVRFCLFLLPSR